MRLGKKTLKKFDNDVTTLSGGASWLKFFMYFGNIFPVFNWLAFE